MSKRSWLARLLVGGLLAGGLLFVQSPPSKADCIWVQAYLTRENQAPLYLWNGCVYPTDWGYLAGTGAGDDRPGVVPTGVPNGAFIYVKIPVP